ERALDLWDRVPDPVESAGMVRADLLRLAAESRGLANDRDRGRALIDEAISQLGPDADPLLASRLHATRSTLLAWYGDGEGARVSAERAVAFAAGTESVELAHALAVLAETLYCQGRCAGAVEVGRRAARVAREVGSGADEGKAQLWT